MSLFTNSAETHKTLISASDEVLADQLMHTALVCITIHFYLFNSKLQEHAQKNSENMSLVSSRLEEIEERDSDKVHVVLPLYALFVANPYTQGQFNGRHTLVQ
jgi:hypothetical protein